MANLIGRTDGMEDSLQVLVLDDEQAILSSIKSLFRKLPYKFRFFTSPAAALQVIRSNEIDVVVSDLRMNETNGLEFMKEVTRVAPLSERVLMSGFEDKAIILLALSAGMINHFVYKPWEDDDFKDLLARCSDTRGAFKRRDENDILYEFDDLPSPPKFQQRLSEMLASLTVPIGMIVQEIEMNPALVAKLIRIANSVHLGVRKRVTTVKDAVFFIGLEYISSMVTALEAFGAYSSRVPAKYAVLIEEMTLGAVRRGMVAKEIAAKWPGLDNRYVPYVASLLQDIGLFARICLRSDQYDAFLKTKEVLNFPPREAEVKVFGNYTHDKIGGAKLEHWNFPPDIVRAVKDHHSRPAANDYARIIQLAGVISGSADGFPVDDRTEQEAHEWREKLGYAETEVVQNQGEKL